MGLALVGCAAGLATMHWAVRPSAAKSPPAEYLELPLTGVPLLRGGGVAGLSFVRLGVVGRALAEADPATVEAFVADALLDATLGQPGGIDATSRTADPARLKAAIPVRLERAAAPFALDRIVIVQSEFRSHDQLRELADQDGD